MTRSFICRTTPQNCLFGNKNKFASIVPTESNNIFILSSALTPAPAVTSATTLSSVARYLEGNLQQILKTVLDFRPSSLSLAIISAL